LPGRFTFDGKEIPYEDGDTLGSALHRAGVKVLSRSLRYHRPRGLYCCTGSCASCLVDVDGVPNLPACMTSARACKVTSQNRIGSAKHDLLGVVDKVYRGGFDPHAAFTQNRLLNEAFIKGVRFMSGLGKAPPPETRAPGPRRHTVAVDELIVGAGRLGLQRAHDALGRVLLIDELDTLGGSARWDPLEHDSRRLAATLPRAVEAWTSALCFGIYDEGGRRVAGVVRTTAEGQDLWEVSARRITIAPGRHDAWPTFPNNDLPGILSLRGAQRLLGEHGVLPGSFIVVHGSPLPARFLHALQAKGARIMATGTVTDAAGTSAIDEAFVGGQWVRCDAIVCNLPGTPRVELFQQAGCALRFAADGTLTPVLDQGRTNVPGIDGAFSVAAEGEHVEVLR
jgi:sarcosine oxidase subunit alpha